MILEFEEFLRVGSLRRIDKIVLPFTVQTRADPKKGLKLIDL